MKNLFVPVLAAVGFIAGFSLAVLYLPQPVLLSNTVALVVANSSQVGSGAVIFPTSEYRTVVGIPQQNGTRLTGQVIYTNVLLRNGTVIYLREYSNNLRLFGYTWIDVRSPLGERLGSAWTDPSERVDPRGLFAAVSLSFVACLALGAYLYIKRQKDTMAGVRS